MEKILVSACLLGINCKYNGKNNYIEEIEEIKNRYQIISFCPEESSGLSTPRTPSEIKNGKVFSKDGRDLSAYFIRGAEKALEICKKENIKLALLKEKSPSCGSSYIYDGSFSNKLIKSPGITSRLLMENSIKIYSENEIKELLK